jgi:hypothetical protein
MTDDHVYTWEEGARLARGQYEQCPLVHIAGSPSDRPHAWGECVASRIQPLYDDQIGCTCPFCSSRQDFCRNYQGQDGYCYKHKLYGWHADTWEETSILARGPLYTAQSSKQPVFDMDGVVDDGDDDIPLLIVWMVSFVAAMIPVGMVEGVMEHLFIQDSPIQSFIGWLAATTIVSLLVTTVTYHWHDWMAAWGESICRRLGLGVTTDTKDAPPINVDDEKARWSALREDKGYVGMPEGEQALYGKDYWRESDERNGIHRTDTHEERVQESIRAARISSSVGAAPTSTIKRGTGLHHFTFTIGFRHDREE